MRQTPSPQSDKPFVVGAGVGIWGLLREVISALFEAWYLLVFCLGNCKTELGSFYRGSRASSSLSVVPATLPGIAVRYQPDASGSSGLRRADSCASRFSSSQAIIRGNRLPAENGGSSVSCQPEAILFLSDSFGAHYLLFCLAACYVKTLRCCRKSAKS